MDGGFAETSVTFSRAALTETVGGGFRKSPTGAYLTAYCHVEVEERTDPNSISTGLGQIQVRYWRVFLPNIGGDVALDPTVRPLKGDRVRFTTDYGVTIDLPIRYVQSPDSILDHYEIETEEDQ